MQLYVKFDKV